MLVCISVLVDVLIFVCVLCSIGLFWVVIVSVLDNVNDDVGSVLDGGVLIGVVVVVGDGFGDSDGCV